jgi:hypothetical protein
MLYEILKCVALVVWKWRERSDDEERKCYRLRTAF